MSGVFVSHAHSDEPLVRALAAMLERLFRTKIGAVNYSSRKERGGIEPGEEWFGWIVNQVRDADFVLLMLTPNSAAKPWLIWEAGAAVGAAISRDRQRPLIPLLYGMSSATVPGPMSRLQTVRGEQGAEMRKLVDRFYKFYRADFTPDDAVQYGESLKGALDEYVGAVEAIPPRLPISVTEAAIQEWVDRLDDLKRQGRFAETRVYESWINVAFGRSGGKNEPPLDLRIHRRLAALFDAAGEAGSVDAERQYELARRAAPRDIFTLRGLGKTKLDRGDLDGCKAVIAEIESLDGAAFVSNPENAALKARWQKRTGDELGRLAFLKEAYGNMPSSFYIGDLLGRASSRATISMGRARSMPRCSTAFSTTARTASGAGPRPPRRIWSSATPRRSARRSTRSRRRRRAAASARASAAASPRSRRICRRATRPGNCSPNAAGCPPGGDAG